MNAMQLIGKMAIRTKPCEWDRNPSPFGMGFGMGVETKAKTQDYSYSSEPILILAATENHIVYTSRHNAFDRDSKHILDSRWCDDNWTDYDELMKLAEPAIQELVKEAASVSEIP